jgi:hypothetical protein
LREGKNVCDVELSHSRSEKVVAQYRGAKEGGASGDDGKEDKQSEVEVEDLGAGEL